MKLKKRLERIERYITRDKIKFTRRVQVSGCVAALTTVGQDKELAYQVARAKQELIRELEVSGHLRVVPLPRTGDDKKSLVILEI